MGRIGLGLLALLAGAAVMFVGCEDWGEHEHEAPIVMITQGHPDVTHAVEDSFVQIGNLQIHGRSSLTYSWVKNDLSVWGLSKGEAGALACAGYQEGDHYVCGKFDWISSDRLSRPLENINSEYNGFSPEKFYSAPRRCFFIISKDGARRTNVIFDN